MYITNMKYLFLWCRVTECGMNGKYGIQENKTQPKQLARTEGHKGATRSRYQSIYELTVSLHFSMI